MTDKASTEDGPRLLIVAEARDGLLHVIDREIDIVRARRRADMSVADGQFFRAWVLDAMYEAVAPGE